MQTAGTTVVEVVIVLPVMMLVILLRSKPQCGPKLLGGTSRRCCRERDGCRFRKLNG